MKKRKKAKRDRLRKELEQELLQLRASQPGGSGAGDLQAGELFSGRAFGAGALGAVALLLAAEHRDKLRPVVVQTMKELFRFRDWLRTDLSGLQEDLEDMAAEAHKGYEAEIAERLAAVERERELLQRLQDLAKQRAAEGK